MDRTYIVRLTCKYGTLRFVESARNRKMAEANARFKMAHLNSKEFETLTVDTELGCKADITEDVV